MAIIIGTGADDVWLAAASSDSYFGLAGQDTVSYAGSAGGVTVDLGAGTGSGGDADGDTYDSIENVIGSDRDDVIIGSTADNELLGGRGSDMIWDGDSFAQAGDDMLRGGTGNDHMIAGMGNDRYVVSRGDGNDIVDQDPTIANDFTTTIDSLLFSSDGGGNITHQQLWFQQVGSDLRVSVIGEADSMVTLLDWYGPDASRRVDQIEVAPIGSSNGSHILVEARVQALVDTMAAYSPPAQGEFTLDPVVYADVLSAMAAAWG